MVVALQSPSVAHGDGALIDFGKQPAVSIVNRILPSLDDDSKHINSADTGSSAVSIIVSSHRWAITEPLLHLFYNMASPLPATTVSDLQVALGLVAAGEGIAGACRSLQTVRTEQVSYQRLVHETSPHLFSTHPQRFCA
jgi:hypothetical protein